MSIAHNDPMFEQHTRTIDADGSVRDGLFQGRTDGATFDARIGAMAVHCTAVWEGETLVISSDGPMGQLVDCWSLEGQELRMAHRAGVLAGQIAILTRMTQDT